MKSQTENLLNQDCERCHRKGFTWARGNCQYCGHRQFNDELFLAARDERKQLNAEAIEAYREVKRKIREDADAAGDNDGGFSDWDDGGDGGGDD